MFRGIEEYSRGRPEQPVGLWLQVRVENERAIGFYRKIGFEPDETLGQYISQDKAHKLSLEMRKLF